MKYLIITALVTLVAHISTAAAQDCKTGIETINPGQLVVASYDYPPFAETESDGSIGGIDFDVVAVVAAENCLKIERMAMTGAGAVQSIVSSKADVAIGGWTRTRSREKVVGLSGPIYLDPSAIISKEGISTISGLEKKVVGTVSGYLFVPALQALLGDNLKLYPDSVAMAQDLSAGRIDAGMDGYSSALYSQKSSGGYAGMQIKVPEPDERVPTTLHAEQAGILYTKGNRELGEALDAAVVHLRESGKLAAALTAAGLDPALAHPGESVLANDE